MVRQEYLSLEFNLPQQASVDMKWSAIARVTIFALAIGWVAYVWTRGTYPPNSDRAYVRAVYRAVLNREPDSSGFATNYKRLETGKVTRVQMLHLFLCSSEFQHEHPNERAVCAK